MGQKPKPSNELTLIDSLDLATVESIIEGTPKGEAYPQEVADYLRDLEVVRSQLMRYKDKSYIIKVLMGEPYSLTRFKANKRYNDALDFFYVDKEVKAMAYANLTADKLESTANALRPLIRSFNDLKVWVEAMCKATELRLRFVKDDTLLPEEKKPVRIYTADVSLLGENLENDDREKLKAYIRQFDIPEKERQRIMAESGVTEHKIDLEHETPGD